MISQPRPAHIRVRTLAQVALAVFMATIASTASAQPAALASGSAPAPPVNQWPTQLDDWSYRPFIDPLNLHDWWWTLIVPLSLGVAIAYKAVRLPNLDRYWREVIVMTVQILLGMAGLAAALWLLVEVYVRTFRGS
jgi:hypothetical protein